MCVPVDSLVFVSCVAPGGAHGTVTAAPCGTAPPLPRHSPLGPMALRHYWSPLVAQGNGPGVETRDALQLPVVFGMR